MPKIRIVAISDTHDFHHALTMPKGDILIHAGDMTNHGDLAAIGNVNDWLGTLSYSYKLIIAGNHDWVFQTKPEEARALITNAIYLEDSEVEVEGLRIYGSPWQPEYHHWAFNLPRGQKIAEKWQLISEGLDILITHGPPFGYGDTTKRGIHQGCEDLLKRVQLVKPRVHIFGHMHEAYGISIGRETVFINAAICSPPPLQIAHLPMVFDLIV